METSVKRVFVEVIDNGKSRVLPCPIRTKDGKLMTQRLRRLLAGKYQWSYGSWCDISDDAHVFISHDVFPVGLVWRKPYTLLEEIAQSRLELQYELYMLEGSSDLTQATPVLVLPDSSNFEISSIMWRELELRHAIKRRIKELGEIKNRQANSHEYRYGCDGGHKSDCANSHDIGDDGRDDGDDSHDGGGWMQP